MLESKEIRQAQDFNAILDLGRAPRKNVTRLKRLSNPHYWLTWRGFHAVALSVPQYLLEGLLPDRH
jgi:hypothetical protein